MLVEIQVLPSPTGPPGDTYAHIDAAIDVIASRGVRYEVGALGTTVEGHPDTLWPLLREVHEATLRSGADQVITVIKVAEAADDDGHLAIDRLTARHREDR